MTRRSDHGSALSAVLTVLVVLIVTAGAVTGGYLGTRALRRHWEHTGSSAGSTPTAAASVLAHALTPPTVAPSPGASAPLPDAAAVARALREPLASPALGSPFRADVVDAATGTALLSLGSQTAGAPASTAKLLAAAAVLLTRGPAYRIATDLRAGAAGTVVLVGGGDPTLTAAASGEASDYPDAARLADLAAAARRAGLHVTRVVVDDSAFAGPAISPTWAPGDVPSSDASAITAVMSDGGRAAPGDVVRSAAPDLATGHQLADLLGVPGASVVRGIAAAGSQVIATVHSAPISELVEQMLQNSDNMIAECLVRQVALAQHSVASFTGAAQAVRATLAAIHADPGPGMVDGSGLAASDRLSPAALVTLLRAIVAGQDPVLHDIVTALPVAGWSGTLSDRYLAGSGATAGAGVVRAKTGTLTGVSTLAGIVHDADGRVLVFALMGDAVPAGDSATALAEAALDRIAATLAQCGCR